MEIPSQTILRINITHQICLSVLLTLIAFFGRAQTPETDSIKNLLSKARGTELVDITNKLAFDWYLYNSEKSNELSTKALLLAEQLHYTKGIAEASINQGIYQYLTGNSKKGQQLLLKGQKLANDSKSKGLEGFAFVQLGNLNRNLGQYDSAELFYNQSYEILKDSLYPSYLGALYANLSKLYGQFSQPKNEIKYLLRAYAVREKLSDKVVKIDALLLLSAWYTKEYDLGKANHYLGLAEKLICTNTPTEIIIDFKNQKATLLSIEGNYEQALNLFDEVKSFYLENTTPQIYIGALSDIGFVFEQIGDYEASQNIYSEALELSNVKNYPLQQTKLNIRLGWINYYLKQYESGITFVIKALGLAKANGFRFEEGDASNLLGNLLEFRGKYDEAQINYEKGFTIRREINDKKGIAASLGNLGGLMEKRGNLKSAFILQSESLSIKESIAHRPGMAWSYFYLGRLNMKLQSYARSEEYLAKAEKEARLLKMDGILMQALSMQRELLERQGKIKEALIFSKKYELVIDSIHQHELHIRISNIQSGYKLDQKDKRIELLNKNKKLQENNLVIQRAKVKQQWFIIATVVAALIFFVSVAALLYKNNAKTKVFNKEITARKEEIQVQSEILVAQNAELNNLNIEKNNLIGIVAHDLKSPLNQIKGLVSVIKLSPNSVDKETTGYIQMIENSASRLTNMISKILDVQAIDSKQLNLTFEPVNFSEVVQSITDRFAIEAKRKQIQLRSSIENNVIVKVDRSYTDQVIENLISNAIKFSPSDKNIYIKISTNDNTALCEIRDEGPGLSEDDKKQLFRKYQRLSATPTGNESSTGLGLSIV